MQEKQVSYRFKSIGKCADKLGILSVIGSKKLLRYRPDSDNKETTENAILLLKI
jgi:hypothetical protein